MIWCQANCCPSMSSASRLTTDCPIANVGLGSLAGNDGISANDPRRTLAKRHDRNLNASTSARLFSPCGPLSQSRHADRRPECPLSGVDRTSEFQRPTTPSPTRRIAPRIDRAKLQGQDADRTRVGHFNKIARKLGIGVSVVQRVVSNN